MFDLEFDMIIGDNWSGSFHLFAWGKYFSGMIEFTYCEKKPKWMFDLELDMINGDSWLKHN